MHALHAVSSFLLAAMRGDANFATGRIVSEWTVKLEKIGERLSIDANTAPTRIVLRVRNIICKDRTQSSGSANFVRVL